MEIPFIKLERTFQLHQREYELAVTSTLRSGWYILGAQLTKFESEFASYLGAKYCIGVGCGQDALILAVRALGISSHDEVIVAGNTYIATVLGITENGATPIFVDCDEYYEMNETLIESSITDKTRAVLITHLYGQCCNLRSIKAICDRYGIYLIEDCAQSHGARFDGAMSGTVGDLSCFSFYPTKPLGAFGDAGACVTNNKEVADRLRMLRNYGSKKKYINESCGINSRLDEIQAAVLRVGLLHLRDSNYERIRIANRYLNEINNCFVDLPKTRVGSDHVYHVFAVRCLFRDKLQEHLNELGIQTQVHYPIPPHQAECYRNKSFVTGLSLPLTESYAKMQLSLPIYSGMPDKEISYVIDAVNSFEALSKRELIRGR